MGIQFGFSHKNPDLWAQIGLKYLKFITLKFLWFDKSLKIFSKISFVVQYGEENTKFPLITDATIQKNVLEIIDKSEEWLLDELKKQGYNLREVFLCEYEKEQLFITTY